MPHDLCEHLCRIMHPLYPHLWCDVCREVHDHDVNAQADEHDLSLRALAARSATPATDSERRAWLDERAPLVERSPA